MSNLKLTLIFTYFVSYYIIVFGLLIYFEIIGYNSWYYDINCLDGIISTAVETDDYTCINKNNTNIFSIFINLFDKSNTSYIYYPSKFLPISPKNEELDFSLLEIIANNQYVILDYSLEVARKHIHDLEAIMEEYMSRVNTIILS